MVMMMLWLRVIRRMILSRMMIINKTMLNMIMMTF